MPSHFLGQERAESPDAEEDGALRQEEDPLDHLHPALELSAPETQTKLWGFWGLGFRV